MLKDAYNVIGVMSGTSLDGIDLAHVLLMKNGERWTFELLECETIPYSADWVTTLTEAVTQSPSQLDLMNRSYTKLLAGVISDFISRHKLAPGVVCSHGHTVLHRPNEGITLQIGNRPELAALLNQVVVCDFRASDVTLGGQGAPLVPIGDRLLFSDFDYCLNLGGFSNVSFELNDERIAFDISAVNTVLNHYSLKLGFAYDDNGGLARSGAVSEKLLAELNALDYYRLSFPKSLGFEFVREIVLPLIDRHDLPAAAVLHTFCEHIAIQIGNSLPNKSAKMLVTGGGAYNGFLIGKIKSHLPQLQIEIPTPKTIEYKEALIFALLGVLRLRNEINVLSSVTGASHDHCSGNVFYPN